MQFNPKINTDGKYRNYEGWSVISMLENDFKFLENYIQKNNLLKSYFSALPSTSYHITIHTIWSEGSPQLKSLYRYNYSLLYRLFLECNKDTWSTLQLKIEKIYFNEENIGILIKRQPVMDRLAKTCATICENNIDNIPNYHVTLAYKYKDINDKDLEKIRHEVNILNILFENQTVNIKRPSVYSFSDMTKYTDIIQAL